MSDTKNMTGEQIQKVMDFLLYQALETVVLHSDVFDDQIAVILSLTATNRKRKVSALEKEELIGLLSTCLVTTDRKHKFELFKACKIERSFVHGFLRNVTIQNETFLPNYSKFVAGDSELRTYLDNVAYLNMGTSRHAMWRIMTHVKSFLNKFFEFRTQVMENYLRLSTVHAKSHISGSPNGQYDFNDLRQSILKAVLVALDKYDSSKGALTTYINWWVLNAQTSSSEHEYGVAYTVPQSYKRKIAEQGAADTNFSVSLDSLYEDDEGRSLHSVLSDGSSITADCEREEEVEIVRALAKAVDSRGIARLVLDIGESFTKKELNAMRRQMLRENCK